MKRDHVYSGTITADVLQFYTWDGLKAGTEAMSFCITRRHKRRKNLCTQVSDFIVFHIRPISILKLLYFFQASSFFSCVS